MKVAIKVNQSEVRKWLIVDFQEVVADVPGDVVVVADAAGGSERGLLDIVAELVDVCEAKIA